jgi:hypothetical protein
VRRLLVILLAVTAGACGKKSDATTTMPSTTALLVYGTDMGPLFENVALSRGGAPVSGAQVSVNGTALSETSTGFYYGKLPATVPVGAGITIEVHAGNQTVTGTAIVPQTPVLTAPTAGSSVHPGTALSFTWTDSADPDEFEAGITYTVGSGGTSQETAVAGSARSASVATAAIPASATNLNGYLFAYANGTFSGDADPGSRMHVRQPANGAALVLQ